MLLGMDESFALLFRYSSFSDLHSPISSGKLWMLLDANDNFTSSMSSHNMSRLIETKVKYDDDLGDCQLHEE